MSLSLGFMQGLTRQAALPSLPVAMTGVRPDCVLTLLVMTVTAQSQSTSRVLRPSLFLYLNGLCFPNQESSSHLTLPDALEGASPELGFIKRGD